MYNQNFIKFFLFFITSNIQIKGRKTPKWTALHQIFAEWRKFTYRNKNVK